MAFIYPGYFPSGCWEESDIDPLTIIDNPLFAPFKPYNFALTLEQAMEIIWKVKEWDISGSTSWVSINEPANVYNYTTTGVNKISPNSFGQYALMSEIICTEIASTIQTRNVNRTLHSTTITILDGATLFIPLTITRPNGNIYGVKRYENRWYLPISAIIGQLGIAAFPQTSSSLASGSVTIEFLNGTTVISNSVTNVSQIPDTVASGNILIRPAVERDAS